MREPAFWWRAPSSASGLLAPAAALYGSFVMRRMARNGARAGVPVICAGNFTLGGAGKTPAAILIAAMLTEAGERPFCLSRGYGGSAAGPKRVEAGDTAGEVGDEALLLARAAPTIVAADRTAGAELAKAQGASVIVMDDGLQNPSLAKNLTIGIIDARRGIGNEKVFPAGPLRAPLEAQLARSDALLLVGDGDLPREVSSRAPSLPVFHGRLLPDAAALAKLKGQRLLAFAGIGDPEKFFATIRAAGLDLARQRGFADHHRCSAGEAAELIETAARENLTLLTTEKDFARMQGDAACASLAARAQTLPVTLEIAERDAFRALVFKALGR
jgi:tetraacyldisaccharide 4'-kinase